MMSLIFPVDGEPYESKVTIATFSVPVGYWVLYPQQTGFQTKFSMYHRPTDEQIKNTEELLGWGWEDSKEITE